jgi:hypothetical protein
MPLVKFTEFLICEYNRWIIKDSQIMKWDMSHSYLEMFNGQTYDDSSSKKV